MNWVGFLANVCLCSSEARGLQGYLRGGSRQECGDTHPLTAVKVPMEEKDV